MTFQHFTVDELTNRRVSRFQDNGRRESGGPLNAMMERAGMSEMDIYNRTRDIFLHFKLPFDAPPPEE